MDMAGMTVIDLVSDSESDDGLPRKVTAQPTGIAATTKPTKTTTMKTMTKTKPTRDASPTSTTTAIPITTTPLAPPLAPIFAKQATTTSMDSFVTASQHARAADQAQAQTQQARKGPTRTETETQTPMENEGGDASALVAGLNDAQRRAVTTAADTVAILAGPGSGKTHTLTSRVAFLVACRGLSPRNVVVATFTVKAAREMKVRIGKVLGEDRARQLVLGTFHSVALRYLWAYGSRVGLPKDFGIADDGDARAIVKRVVAQLKLPGSDAGAARDWISKTKTGVRGAAAEATESEAQAEALRTGQPRAMHSVAQAAGLGAGAGSGHESRDFTDRMRRIYEAYQAHLTRQGLLDFDDLLVKCVELLRAHPACVGNVEAVLIDEYQDTNGVQFELMNLLAQARRRITVVGDPDQSIYGWRNAETTNLSRFLATYPATAEVSLEENYRSSRRILETALAVIQQDGARYDKSLLSVHRAGAQPVFRALRSASVEAEWIAREIWRAVRQTGGLVTFRDVAVLVRSAALARAVEQGLLEARIPYRMVGGTKFFDRAEIRALVDYLRVVCQPSNSEALARIINVPKRGIGDATLGRLQAEADARGEPLWDVIAKHCRGDVRLGCHVGAAAEKGLARLVNVMRRLRRRLETDDDEPETVLEMLVPTRRGKAATDSDTKYVEPRGTYTLEQLVQALLHRLNYRTFLANTHAGDDEARWEHVEEFVGMVRAFEANAAAVQADARLPDVEGVDQSSPVGLLASFLSNITLAGEDAKTTDKENVDNGAVTVSTIHAAKGLEWPVVFIPSVCDGVLPHKRSTDDAEERRLLYVAMTRAQCLLNLSFGLFYGGHDGGDDGRFVGEREVSPFVEPVRDTWFATTGPTYDRQLLTDMGHILQRPVPTEQAIYDAMPPGADIEDTYFPADPRDNGKRRTDATLKKTHVAPTGTTMGTPIGSGPSYQMQPVTLSSGTGHAYRGYTTTMDKASSGTGHSYRGYTTTMDKASSFTTASGGYSSFVTAAQHRQLVPEASVRPVPARSHSAGTSKSKSSKPAKPLTGQQAILDSFYRNPSTPTSDAQPLTQGFTQPTFTEPGYMQPGYIQPGYIQPGYTQPMFTQSPGFAPEFAQPAQPMFAQPGFTQPAQTGFAQPGFTQPGFTPALPSHQLGPIRGNLLSKVSGAGASNDWVPGAQYPHFSSSPTRPVPEPGPAPELGPAVDTAPPDKPYAYKPPRPYHRTPSITCTSSDGRSARNGRSASAGYDLSGQGADVAAVIAQAAAYPPHAPSQHTTVVQASTSRPIMASGTAAAGSGAGPARKRTADAMAGSGPNAINRPFKAPTMRKF